MNSHFVVLLLLLQSVDNHYKVFIHSCIHLLIYGIVRPRLKSMLGTPLI